MSRDDDRDITVDPRMSAGCAHPQGRPLLKISQSKFDS